MIILNDGLKQVACLMVSDTLRSANLSATEVSAVGPHSNLILQWDVISWSDELRLLSKLIESLLVCNMLFLAPTCLYFFVPACLYFLSWLAVYISTWLLSQIMVQTSRCLVVSNTPTHVCSATRSSEGHCCDARRYGTQSWYVPYTGSFNSTLTFLNWNAVMPTVLFRVRNR